MPLGHQCIYFPLSPEFGIDNQTTAYTNSLSGGNGGGRGQGRTSATSGSPGLVSCN